MMVAFGILFFLSLIAGELFVANRRGQKIYQSSESLSHLVNGFGQQLVNLFIMAGLIAVYQSIRDHYGFFEFPRDRWESWALAVIFGDLAYYWGHRAGHRTNLVIAVHSVHHQAQDYNFLSAFRLPWFNRLMIFCFFLPLAFAGFSAEMLFAGFALNSLVATLAHSGLHRKDLGLVGRIFVTPRTHYVHHGVNGKYLDKNFGGIFIFWDRLFGTYVDLDENLPVQLPGAESPRYSSSFIANTDYFRRIAFVMQKRGGLSALSLLFESPERMDEDFKRFGGEAAFSRSIDSLKPDAPVPVKRIAIAFAAFMALLGGLSFFLSAPRPLWQTATAILFGFGVLLSTEKWATSSKD